MTTLAEALKGFTELYRADKSLCADMRGWHSTIRLEPLGTESPVSLTIEDGRVIDIAAGAEPAGLTVRSDRQVLLDILEFRLDPNHPYLFGELTIEGKEEDFLRLDYVVTRLCDR